MGGALKALGIQVLTQLAQKTKLAFSPLDLAALLDMDNDLKVDFTNMALRYQCRGLTANATQTVVPEAGAAGTTAPSAADPTDLTVAQAFNLSSRPGATRKILLDFTGHTTTGTQWNLAAGRTTIVTPPYDKDNSSSTWSADELRDIYAIWRAVAEDYAMFDVDVTTVDPGDAALAGTGVRVAIGGSYMDWYGSVAGGVAYVGSFGVNTQQPTFVFTQNLGPNYAKYVWEAVSHEVGHTLGLTHDGLVGGTVTYYSGQGDWAPIMGVGYYKAVTQFDKGEYAGSNNPQDDLAVIGAFLPLLPQAAGTSMAIATPLNASVVDAATGVATGKAVGVVSSAGGNWFSFQAAAGTATLSAAVAAPWSGSTNRANLDIQLVVYDANAAVVVSINPPGADAINGLGVPATAVTLPAGGTYFIAVTGAGAGDPASTGYSSYDSRGQFELSAAYTPYNGSMVTLSNDSTNGTLTPPSPSPSPLPPSPSPSPPVGQAMRVSRIPLGVTGSLTRSCTASVYVVNVANVNLAGAVVTGVWSSADTPTFGGTTVKATTSAISGYALFTSQKTISFTPPVASCTFTVTSVTLAGYYLDVGASVMSNTRSV